MAKSSYKGLAWLALALGIIVGIGIGFVTEDFQAGLKGFCLGFLLVPFLVLSIFVIVLTACGPPILVHELGHLVAAKVIRATVLAFAVGPWTITFEGKYRYWSLRRAPQINPFQRSDGFVSIRLSDPKLVHRHWTLFALAGPLTSLLWLIFSISVTYWLLAEQRFQFHLIHLLWLYAAMVFLATVLPLQYRSFSFTQKSDMQTVLDLRAETPEGRRFRALLSGADISRPQLFEDLTELKDETGPDLTAHLVGWYLKLQDIPIAIECAHRVRALLAKFNDYLTDDEVAGILDMDLLHTLWIEHDFEIAAAKLKDIRPTRSLTSQLIRQVVASTLKARSEQRSTVMDVELETMFNRYKTETGLPSEWFEHHLQMAEHSLNL